jgi:hypothetical protein
VLELLTVHAGLVQGVALWVIVGLAAVAIGRWAASRRRPVHTPDPHAADIREARRQLRGIEWQLAQLDTRVHVAEVRRLTALHEHWRRHLAQYGVNHPAPVVAW